jgi:hypothetical protein
VFWTTKNTKCTKKDKKVLFFNLIYSISLFLVHLVFFVVKKVLLGPLDCFGLISMKKGEDFLVFLFGGDLAGCLAGVIRKV